MPRRSVVAVAVTAYIAGCASFRAGKLTTVESWPLPKIEHQQSVSLVISGHATDNGNPGEVGADFGVWRDQTVRAYKESGLFSTVALGLAESDLRADITLTKDQELNVLATAFTFLTLGVFPGVITNTFSLQTEIKDQNGRSLGTFEGAESERTWIALVLLPLTPAKSPQTTVANIVYDLNRTALTDLHRSATFNGL